MTATPLAPCHSQRLPLLPVWPLAAQPLLAAWPLALQGRSLQASSYSKKGSLQQGASVIVGLNVCHCRIMPALPIIFCRMILQQGMRCRLVHDIVMCCCCVMLAVIQQADSQVHTPKSEALCAASTAP